MKKEIRGLNDEIKREQNDKSKVEMRLQEEKRRHDLTKKHLEQSGNERKKLLLKISNLEVEIKDLDHERVTVKN